MFVFVSLLYPCLCRIPIRKKNQDSPPSSTPSKESLGLIWTETEPLLARCFVRCEQLRCKGVYDQLLKRDLQDDELDIPGLAKTGGKTRFSRSAWGFELKDLLDFAIALLYEPELLVIPNCCRSCFQSNRTECNSLHAEPEAHGLRVPLF
jgi:hypothetical protein